MFISLARQSILNLMSAKLLRQNLNLMSILGFGRSAKTVADVFCAANPAEEDNFEGRHAGTILKALA